MIANSDQFRGVRTVDISLKSPLADHDEIIFRLGNLGREPDALVTLVGEGQWLRFSFERWDFHDARACAPRGAKVHTSRKTRSLFCAGRKYPRPPATAAQLDAPPAAQLGRVAPNR